MAVGFSSRKTIAKKKGFIADAVTAKEAGEKMISAIYGKQENLKFKVGFDSKENIWLIQGMHDIVPATTDDKTTELYIGGEPYAAINKADGNVLGIWHTK